MGRETSGVMRLDKYLSSSGLGTRSEVKKFIKNGLVTVDGGAPAGPEQKIGPDTAVCFRGEPVEQRTFSYYMFHKPAGCITARTKPGEQTVMDYFPAHIRGLSPVGRLDKDTEGLLLVTNDGALNHHLTSPARHVEKTYYAVMDQPVPSDAMESFLQGVDIGDEKPTSPAVLEILPEDTVPCGGKAHAMLTITEGRYHQVKRMFGAFGCKVLYLKRISLGPLTLGSLARGEYRALSGDEIAGLKQGGKR